jgi:hypothetical protein
MRAEQHKAMQCHCHLVALLARCNAKAWKLPSTKGAVPTVLLEQHAQQRLVSYKLHLHFDISIM